jgi:hypothetical protein
MTILNCALINLFVPYCTVTGFGIALLEQWQFCKHNDH